MPYKTWGCSICGKQAPKKYRADGKFAERMRWLRHHRKTKHLSAHRKSIAKGLKSKGY